MKLLCARILSLATLAATLTACGGGSSNGFSPPPPPPPGGSGWQPGVFQDYNNFYARCEAPRSGVDPATAQPYPDVAGSTLDENNFLRSYSNDTYLWYDEITDRDPGLYDDPLDYFDLLKTNATTPSGAPKDKFHFTYDSEEWFQLSQGGVSFGYGAQFALLSTLPPREVVIVYTETDSPATELMPPLQRGDRVIRIDGFDIDTNTQAGVDALNEALFPTDSTPHEFEIENRDGGTRTVTMTPEEITSDPVQSEKIIESGGRNIGYMVFNDHIATAEQALIDAINFFNDNGPIDDLILDIRYNGGGYLALASELAYMIADPVVTANQTFELLQFNNKHPNTNPVTGDPILPTPFFDTTLGPPFNGNNGVSGSPLPTLGLSRVFVITGPGTCSASEAIMNGLRGVNVEVIQIGSTTCGKPYGFYATDNCGTTYFTIQFRGVNAKNFGDYTDGFSPNNTLGGNVGTPIPGCSVADDFTKLLGDETEGRLAAALSNINTGTCPAPTGLAPELLGKPGAPLDASDPIVPKSPWHTNRIMEW